jgi:hypothetical protein
MEQYLLTQEDIERLNLTGVMAGEPATIEEMKLLGLPVGPSQEEPLPPTVPVEQQTPSTTAPIAPAAPPATAPAVAPAMGGMDMMGLLNLMQPVPQDPFENLSRSQRTMLGFAALRDAGMALQGQEGNAVKNVMADITARADMERKRQATLARQQMLGTVVSGSASGTLDPQAIINAMAAGVLDPATGTAMLTQMEKLRTQKAAQEAIVGGGSGALDDLKRLNEMISSGGMTTGFTGWLFSNLPFSAATAARDVADTLRSGMALGALKELKAGGATLGSVSEKELALLESAIAKLNLDQPRDKVLDQMATIEKHYKDAIRRAYGRASETEKQGFDGFFGGSTPAWVLDTSIPQPTPSTTPSTDDLTEEEKKRLGI